MKVYAVTTYGGQIINDQEPQEIELTAREAEGFKKRCERFGYCRDAFAIFYPTRQMAEDAIRWALSN